MLKGPNILIFIKKYGEVCLDVKAILFWYIIVKFFWPTIQLKANVEVMFCSCLALCSHFLMALGFLDHFLRLPNAKNLRRRHNFLRRWRRAKAWRRTCAPRRSPKPGRPWTMPLGAPKKKIPLWWLLNGSGQLVVSVFLDVPSFLGDDFWKFDINMFHLTRCSPAISLFVAWHLNNHQPKRCDDHPTVLNACVRKKNK